MAILGLFKKKKKDTAPATESKSTAEVNPAATQKADTAKNNDAPAKKQQPAVIEKNNKSTETKTVAAKAEPTKATTSKTAAPKTAPAKDAAPKVTDVAQNKTATKKVAPAQAEKTTVATNKKENASTKKVEKIEVVEEVKTAPTVDSGAYTGKFEINKSKDGKKFFFNLYASNKVGIATSQMYSSSQSAMNGVKSVIANADKAPIEDQSLKNYETLPYPKWEIYVDNGGKYRFRLNASNGSCVCHSQGYTTKNACKNGIDSIIRSSRNPEIEKTYTSKKDED